MQLGPAQLKYLKRFAKECADWESGKGNLNELPHVRTTHALGMTRQRAGIIKKVLQNMEMINLQGTNITKKAKRLLTV